jgi:hypothetical protein
MASHLPDSDRSFRPTPLTSDEEARFLVNMSDYVSQTLLTKGTWRVTSGPEDYRRRWMAVASRVGEILQRKVTCYADSREIVITLESERPPRPPR